MKYDGNMGPFENPLFTHVNIGFNTSGPPREHMYKKSHVWSIAHDSIVGARQTGNPQLRFNAIKISKTTKRKKPNIFNPIYKYTNPANPVMNFCMQKLAAPPW